MSIPDIPMIDISRWRNGGIAEREALARRLDAAMQNSGFLMVENHGISGELKAAIREAASRFFALAPREKAEIVTTVGGRGWVPPGREANAYYGEVAETGKADLKETLTIGRDHSTGDPSVDAEWFAPNVWPAAVPELAELTAQYTDVCRELYFDLLEMCAMALGLEGAYFQRRSAHSPHTLNINRYPALSVTGAPKEGQFRVGPHTDWGILTLLDRQPGYGGLQVQTSDGEWVDAPYAEDAFTVNIGDLLARWTGDRWRSTRHRVLPPSAEAPDEELISLILFCETDADTVVAPLPLPVGGGADYPAVTSADYLLERAGAATVT